MSRGFDAQAHREAFVLGVLTDAMRDGAKKCWRRRGDAFEAARPRPGDYCAKNPEQVAEQDARLAAMATACRNRAEMCVDDADLAAVVGDVLNDRSVA